MTYNKKVAKWAIIAIFVGLFAWGVKVEAAEAGVGLSHAVTHNSKWIGQHIFVSNRDWYLEVARFGNEPRLPDTWRLTTGARVDWRELRKFSPYLKLGVAYYKDEPTWIVSDNLTFDMGIGVRLWGVLDLEYNHNSTGGRSAYNKGGDQGVLYLVRQF